MFITKKHISRRTVLRGAGAALALPLLDAMIPAATALAQTAAQSEAALRRRASCRTAWRRATGFRRRKAHWLRTAVHLEAAGAVPGSRPTILSGLHSRSAEPPPGVTGADHWVAAAFLCADKPKKTAGADVYAGTTIDQIIAQKIGQDTLMPSMQLAVEDPGANSSNCGEGYSCVYTNTISWASPTTPLPMELNPQVVFERMFGDGSTAEQRAARRERETAAFSIRSTAASRVCAAQSSASDRARLDDYTEDVREIERRLQIAMKASTVAPTDMTVPVGVPQSFDEHIKLQFDLLALAFQADITRVGTLLFARDLTGRTYPESEAPTVGFHGGSHHGEDPSRIDQFSKINQYHVKMLAYFVDKLAKTTGRRRHAARSFAAAVRQQHGQLQPAPALRRAARPGRRRKRQAQGRPSPGVSDQDGADRQPAAEHARQVRHSPGDHRRQHGPAGEPVTLLWRHS